MLTEKIRAITKQFGKGEITLDTMWSQITTLIEEARKKPRKHKKDHEGVPLFPRHKASRRKKRTNHA